LSVLVTKTGWTLKTWAIQKKNFFGLLGAWRWERYIFQKVFKQLPTHITQQPRAAKSCECEYVIKVQIN
jgi:hypothetical protein